MPPLGHRWEAAIHLSPDYVIARVTQAGRDTTPQGRGLWFPGFGQPPDSCVTFSTLPHLSGPSFNKRRDCTRWPANFLLR